MKHVPISRYLRRSHSRKPVVVNTRTNRFGETYLEIKKMTPEEFERYEKQHQEREARLREHHDEKPDDDPEEAAANGD